MMPTDLRKIGDQAMKITWSDGHVSELSARYLRQKCQCAHCRNELTGELTLKPESIPEDIKLQKVDVTGNYALTFHFSDSHSTGIYTFENLRALCPCCLPKN